MFEVRPLPREVVVVQDRGPAPENLGDDLARRVVERKGAQVLHQHQVRARESVPDL